MKNTTLREIEKWGNTKGFALVFQDGGQYFAYGTFGERKFKNYEDVQNFLYKQRYTKIMKVIF